jgi:uncharacterized protein (DUF4415 family)
MSKVARKQAREIRELTAMKDQEIDLSDLPEVGDWSGVVVGKFYRPIKKPLTIRLDADVLAWLKSREKGIRLASTAFCEPPCRIRAGVAGRKGLAS